MRISDWSSDVCSSDLRFGRLARFGAVGPFLGEIGGGRRRREHRIALREQPPRREQRPGADHRAGDRMIALAAPDGAAQHAADDPTHHLSSPFRSRSEERRFGKGCAGPFKSRWFPYIYKKKYTNTHHLFHILPHIS